MKPKAMKHAKEWKKRKRKKNWITSPTAIRRCHNIVCRCCLDVSLWVDGGIRCYVCVHLHSFFFFFFNFFSISFCLAKWWANHGKNSFKNVWKSCQTVANQCFEVKRVHINKNWKEKSMNKQDNMMKFWHFFNTQKKHLKCFDLNSEVQIAFVRNKMQRLNHTAVSVQSTTHHNISFVINIFLLLYVSFYGTKTERNLGRTLQFFFLSIYIPLFIYRLRFLLFLCFKILFYYFYSVKEKLFFPLSLKRKIICSVWKKKKNQVYVCRLRFLFYSFIFITFHSKFNCYYFSL